MSGYDDRPGTLYRIFDERGGLLYIGVSVNAFGRIAQHKCDREWWTTARRVELEHFATRHEALAAEHVAVLAESPDFNRTEGGLHGAPRLVCPNCSTVLATRRPDGRGWFYTEHDREAA